MAVIFADHPANFSLDIRTVRPMFTRTSLPCVQISLRSTCQRSLMRAETDRNKLQAFVDDPIRGASGRNSRARGIGRHCCRAMHRRVTSGGDCRAAAEPRRPASGVRHRVGCGAGAATLSLLRKEVGDAYSRYNPLLRELTSFEQALDRRTGATSRSISSGRS